MNYDPKLKEAAEEIKAICVKYDCMGGVVLISKTHAEYLYSFDPSWSLAKVESESRIRFRSKKEDFKSKAEQNEHTEATVFGFTSMLNFGRQTFEAMASLIDQLSDHMEIKYSNWADENKQKENIQ